MKITIEKSSENQYIGKIHLQGELLDSSQPNGLRKQPRIIEFIGDSFKNVHRQLRSYVRLTARIWQKGYLPPKLKQKHGV